MQKLADEANDTWNTLTPKALSAFKLMLEERADTDLLVAILQVRGAAPDMTEWLDGKELSDRLTSLLVNFVWYEELVASIELTVKGRLDTWICTDGCRSR